MLPYKSLADTDRPATAVPEAEPEVLLHAPGSLRLASDALPWQRSLRWGEVERNPRRIWFGVLLATFITVLELGGFAAGMHSYRTAHFRRATTPQLIQVSLIEPPSQVPPPPEPEPPIVVRASRIAVEPPKVKMTLPPPRPEEASDEMRARLGAGAVAAPQLFNADGSVRISGAGAPIQAPMQPKPRTEREAAQQRWAQIEERGNPLDCHKTRFSGAFAPDLSVGDKVASKYLKWIGLADPQAIARRAQQRAESGGCEPAQ